MRLILTDLTTRSQVSGSKLILHGKEKGLVLSHSGQLPAIDVRVECSLVQEVVLTSNPIIFDNNRTQSLNPTLQFIYGTSIKVSDVSTAVLLVYDLSPRNLTLKEKILLTDFTEIIQDCCQRKRKINLPIEDSSANFVIGMLTGLKVPLSKLNTENCALKKIREEMKNHHLDEKRQRQLSYQFIQHFQEFQQQVEDLEDCIQASLQIGKVILPQRQTSSRAPSPALPSPTNAPSANLKNLQIYNLAELVDLGRYSITENHRKQRRIIWNYLENHSIGLSMRSFQIILAIIRYFVNNRLHHYKNIQLILSVQEEEDRKSQDSKDEDVRRRSRGNSLISTNHGHLFPSAFLSPRMTSQNHNLHIDIHMTSSLQASSPSSSLDPSSSTSQSEAERICDDFVQELITLVQGQFTFEQEKNEAICHLLIPCLLKHPLKTRSTSNSSREEMMTLKERNSNHSFLPKANSNELICLNNNDDENNDEFIPRFKLKSASLDEEFFDRVHVKVNRKRFTPISDGHRQDSNVTQCTTSITATTYQRPKNNHSHSIDSSSDGKKVHSTNSFFRYFRKSTPNLQTPKEDKPKRMKRMSYSPSPSSTLLSITQDKDNNQASIHSSPSSSSPSVFGRVHGFFNHLFHA